jgi:hypothetical protein
MNSPRRVLAQFLKYAGLALIVIGGAGVSIGYVGGKDAEARRSTAMKIEIKPAMNAPLKSTGARTTAKAKTKVPPPKVAAAPKATAMTPWRRMMILSGGSVVFGLIGVGWSLHERPPKQPRSAADEMLNEPVPF